MIFHDNRLLADYSHELSIIPDFFRKLEKMLQNLSSAAVVIGTLRVKIGLRNMNAISNSIYKSRLKWRLTVSYAIFSTGLDIQKPST